MKIFIIDTNIVFSCLLNSENRIGDLLLNSKGYLEFYAPAFLRTEPRSKSLLEEM